MNLREPNDCAEGSKKLSYIFEALRTAESGRARTGGAVADVKNSEANQKSRNQATGTEAAPNPAKARAERRKQKRAAMKLSARFRPANSNDRSFQEILATVNASRAGLYFITKSPHFYKGMQLRVTFPYTSAHDTVTGAENYGNVVRLDQLKDGRIGVAVQMRGKVQETQFTQPLQPYGHLDRAQQERRLATRYPFSATALVIEAHSETRLQARCSDLGLGGCYLDTLNPFPEGTMVVLQLSNKGSSFQTIARVSCSHVGMGMGLVFQEPAPDQISILVDWLCVRKPGDASAAAPQVQSAKHLQAAKQPAASAAQGEFDGSGRDVDLLLGLLRLLESKGVLEATTEEEKSESFPAPKS
jgi:hypothetical protein